MFRLLTFSLPSHLFHPIRHKQYGFLYPAVPTFFPLGTEDLAISLVGHAGPKLSLGCMVYFVLSGVKGTSLEAQILLTIKWARPEVVN